MKVGSERHQVLVSNRLATGFRRVRADLAGTGMDSRKVLMVAAGLTMLLLAAAPAVAQLQSERLGVGILDVTEVQRTIPLTTASGLYTAISLRVAGNDLFVERVRLVYGDGGAQDLELGLVVPEVGTAPEIELVGNNRIVTAVVLTYRRPANVMSTTVVEVWGRR